MAETFLLRIFQMSKNIARIVSILLSPPIILLPTPFILVFKKTHDAMISLKWSAFSGIFLFAMIAFVIFGMYEGIFSNFDVSIRKERPKLFLAGAIVGILYLLTLILLSGPRVLFILVLGILLGVIIIGILSRWLKTSIHTASISAFSLSVVILFGVNYIPMLFLIPLMAWSRIEIKKHTPSEVFVGGFLGIFLTIIVYIAGKNFS